MLIEALAMVALAASGMSDSERKVRQKRIQARAVLGQWKELERELGQLSYREYVQALPEGVVKDDALRFLEPFVVRAEIHSDDFTLGGDFEAAPWFEQASDVEILDLFGVGWGGDYEADAVAEYFEGNDAYEWIAHVLEEVRATKNLGFEVHVDPAHAVRWIRRYRPHLSPKVR